MEAVLLIVAIALPVVASIVVAAVRPPGLLAGRVVVIGCGLATLVAALVLGVSASRVDGIVGDVGGSGFVVGRATALLLTAIVATATVVASFARRNIDLDPRRLRFFSLFGVLVSGSAMVVVPGSWFALLIGWIASSWALVGLVGHRIELPSTARAVRRTARALFVGDAALAVAVAVMVAVAGADATRDVSAAAAELAAESVVGINARDLVAVLLIVAGASRSALFPFHRWLVGTLAAPTPVSALVHAGFVSGAGILLIRFGAIVMPSFALQVAFLLSLAAVVVAVGAGSTRVDVKGKLAWSTVGQMGFMVVQCTVGAFSGAVFHIIGHGMYKASMFLGAGDAISAGLRSVRRPAAVTVVPSTARYVASAAFATVAVAVGMLVLPPDVSDAGAILVAVFAWITVAHGVWGWLGRGALDSRRALAVAGVGSVVSVVVYLVGLRLVESFVKPAFDETTIAAAVGVTTLVTALLVIVALAALIWFAPSSAVGRIRAWLTLEFERTGHPGVANLGPGLLARSSRRSAGESGGQSAGSHAVDTVQHGPGVNVQVRADVARAGNIVAPNWPLTSFVAVNPLGGLEQRGFDDAAAAARRYLGARTHLTLAEFRRDHAEGLTAIDDVRRAILSEFTEICAAPPIVVGTRALSAAEIIELDMCHGPDERRVQEAVTALERAHGPATSASRLIDATLNHSMAQFVTHPSSSIDATGKPATFMQRWRRDATRLTDLRWQLHPLATAWLDQLGTDPAEVIVEALAISGVHDEDRVAEMRGHLGRIAGWAGYAKWRTSWAHPSEQRPEVALIDLVAARCALEAACLFTSTGRAHMAGTETPTGPPTPSTSPTLVDRVEAVVAQLGDLSARPEAHTAVSTVLEQVAPEARNRAWLRAQERHLDEQLLTKLDRPASRLATSEIEAQLAFCIDVRSEGLRRHLEASGPYETIGFAGFFGVAMSVRRLEWNHFEARCPVLVTPAIRATEGGGNPADVDRMLQRQRFTAGMASVHSSTKYGLGAPYVMAEAAGWIAGPVAAAKTLLVSQPKRAERPATVMAIDDDPETGLSLEQRVYTAEAVLRTMGLTKEFAPLVVLCGHASTNMNNPHATALDCGACAGASGEDSARTVARLLNDIDVRSRLRERGIDVPADTHFTSGLHETVSDRVDILDRHSIPTSHTEILDRLVVGLDTAARRQSEDRARYLPGKASTVRQRGGDWAQVRPEWGLAGNSSFIIAPRATTAGLDLGGRSFLHTYHADDDVDGKVLETIMTAPLVVGHWISSQYYFSTVDPNTFGAGDKLIHNVVGDVGVIAGESGGLRVGLPTQSTHCGDRRHHQPVRLLAVIEAPIERVERIIRDNAILTTLIEGSWIRVAARSNPDEPWSLRTPNGTWNAEAHRNDITAMTSSTLTETS